MNVTRSPLVFTLISICIGCSEETPGQSADEGVTLQNCDAVIVIDYPNGGWQGPLKWDRPSQLGFSITNNSPSVDENLNSAFDCGTSPTKTKIGDSTYPREADEGYFLGVRATFTDRDTDKVIESKLYTCLFAGTTETLLERDGYRIRVMSREAANEIYGWGE